MSLLDSCKEIFLTIQKYLNLRDFEKLNGYMDEFGEEHHPSELKSILIITKQFKEEPIIKANRKRILWIMEHKLGKKAS